MIIIKLALKGDRLPALTARQVNASRTNLKSHTAHGQVLAYTMADVISARSGASKMSNRKMVLVKFVRASCLRPL